MFHDYPCPWAEEYKKKHCKGLSGMSVAGFESVKELKNAGQYVYRFFTGFSLVF